MNKIKLFINAFIEASNKERLDFFKELFKMAFTKAKNYWLGYVSINKNYIYDVEAKSDSLYTISIIAGRRKDGQWFSNVDVKSIAQIVDRIKNTDKKYFLLYINLGSGASQEYTFNRHQQRILLDELSNILENEVLFED